MSASLQSRARAALAERLRELVAEDALHEDGEHTLRFEDALVPSLTDGDIEWAHAQLAARAKGELKAARSGTVQVHGAWSSTALVCSAFAPWRRKLDRLGLAGLGPFTDLRMEERLHIPHGGGTPNLDIALDSEDGLVGVESKLTEHLTKTKPRVWKPAYRRPAMREALDDAWGMVFEELLEEDRTPRHLDAAQLVMHALSLRNTGALVFVFWEPENADDHPEVRAHRDEVAALAGRLEGAAPKFHALPWSDVLDGWEDAAPRHVASLRRRYAVTVPGG